MECRTFSVKITRELDSNQYVINMINAMAVEFKLTCIKKKFLWLYIIMLNKISKIDFIFQISDNIWKGLKGIKSGLTKQNSHML